jgi:Uma2 family endonuclease
MNLSQPKILTDTWANATWEDYLSAIEDPRHAKSKGYFYNNKLRIEITPVGSDHSCDHTIVIVAVSLFTAIKQIAVTGRDNCSYRKTGSLEVQPDVSYYIGENANVIPWGTGIVDLDVFPPPDLVIEVANTSLSDDQGAKRLMYEDLGVKEYWILDVKNVRVLAFEIVTQGSHRITESNVLPGLKIALLQDALRQTRETNQSQVVAWLMEKFQRS